MFFDSETEYFHSLLHEYALQLLERIPYRNPLPLKGKELGS
jgi:hypothetical protein